MADAPSHCFVIAGKIGNEDAILESTNPVTRVNRLKRWFRIGKRTELWAVPIDAHCDYNEVLSKAFNKIGESYGYAQLLGFVLSDLFKTPNFLKKGEVCSEYIHKILKEIGYFDVDLMTMDPNDVAPDHILKSFRENPKCKLIAVNEYDSTELIYL